MPATKTGIPGCQIYFDILPEITYFNDQILLNRASGILAQFSTTAKLDLLDIEEGLDFCQIRFWLTTIADKIKQFSIWFQAYFRHPSISAELENIVCSTLDNNEQLEVVLSDSSRLLIQPPEIKKSYRQDKKF